MLYYMCIVLKVPLYNTIFIILKMLGKTLLKVKNSLPGVAAASKVTIAE
jgi:hypothetical protein